MTQQIFQTGISGGIKLKLENGLLQIFQAYDGGWIKVTSFSTRDKLEKWFYRIRHDDELISENSNSNLQIFEPENNETFIRLQNKEQLEKFEKICMEIAQDLPEKEAPPEPPSKFIQ